MKIKKNAINGSEPKLFKRSRRYFFKFVGLFSYTAVIITLLPSQEYESNEDESIDDNELFFVDGWVLKKGDIHDL